MSDGEWVQLSTWQADSPMVQVLTAVSVWPTLSKVQRKLVAGCRDLVDSDAEFPRKYRVRIDGIKAPSQTMRSLESKGVVDEHGNLTVPGIYTALWNLLERDEERARKRAPA